MSKELAKNCVQANFTPGCFLPGNIQKQLFAVVAQEAVLKTVQILQENTCARVSFQ